jgi:hypothetical protein
VLGWLGSGAAATEAEGAGAGAAADVAAGTSADAVGAVIEAGGAVVAMTAEAAVTSCAVLRIVKSPASAAKPMNATAPTTSTPFARGAGPGCRSTATVATLR